MEAGDVAVWSPFFIPIAQILRTTSLWGAVPVQLANRLKALMPDLVILGRPRTAEVFTPRLIWHEPPPPGSRVRMGALRHPEFGRGHGRRRPRALH